MDGVHDMGGMDGFGPVRPEKNEPVFHAPWEGRVMAINRAMGATGSWNIDLSRFSREQLPPQVYLGVTYYQKWLLGLEHMLVERDLVGKDEIEAGRALRPGKELKRGPFGMEKVERIMTRGSFFRPAQGEARFIIGEKVRCKNIHPKGHTRLPRYVRGHVGTVERIHGTHAFPDSVAAGKGDDPQWLYTVVFSGRDLWGDDADPTLTVSVDAFEPYLERV